jgi:hypothetical protein
MELLESYFGIHNTRQTYYKLARTWSLLRTAILADTVRFAKLHYGFDYSMVFYDVTTLYFESFNEDELRKNGFSKDSKSQQP